MAGRKKAPQRKSGSEPDPAVNAAVEKFKRQIQEATRPLPRLSERIQELLGRWSHLSPEEPGLLGGNLLAVVNETLLEEQRDRLVANLRHPQPAEDLIDQADYFGAALGEFSTLIRVLAKVELEPGSLAEDWERAADELLQHGMEAQRAAEALENDLEASEAGEERHAPAGMQPVSRRLLADIWRKAESGEQVRGEQARLAEIMRAHPEYRVAWESAMNGAEDTFSVEGVNPFLHVTMHRAVEEQLSTGEPKETAQTLQRLTEAGLDRHEALHRIGNVLLEQMWLMQREGRGFDRAAYIQALNKLKP